MDCSNKMDVKITILQVDVANLRPNTWNTNSVGAQNFEKLKGSIEKLGFFKPILARELEDGFFESGVECNKIFKGFGLVAFYRYGPNQLPNFDDNIAIKVSYYLDLGF